ncbi:hypothetical protein U1Q18_037687 [Sarracenia purpurea var. burkii]
MLVVIEVGGGLVSCRGSREGKKKKLEGFGGERVDQGGTVCGDLRGVAAYSQKKQATAAWTDSYPWSIFLAYEVQDGSDIDLKLVTPLANLRVLGKVAGSLVG